MGLANLTLTEHNESTRGREKQRVIYLNGNKQGSGGIVKTRSIAKESEVAETHDRRGPAHRIKGKDKCVISQKEKFKEDKSNVIKTFSPLII